MESYEENQIYSISNEFQVQQEPFATDSQSPSLANFESCFQFPINTVAELKSLENLLALHTEFRAYFLKRFTSNTMPQRNGLTEYKAAYFVAEQLFTSELLSKFSWQHARQIRKLPFNIYKNVVKAFFDIVSSQDVYYTEIMNANFFKKRLLKNSKKRYLKWRK